MNISEADSHEQEASRLVAGKLSGFTPEEFRALEVLLRHGETFRKDVASLGIPVDLFYQAMDKARLAGLITEREDITPGGTHQSLRINPSFEQALKDHFARTGADKTV